MAHTLRSRPIDVVLVVHTDDFEDDEDADFKSPLSVVESSTTSFAMLEDEAKVCHCVYCSNNAQEEHLRDTLIRGTKIPIPEVKIVSSYFEDVPPTWKMVPGSYIHSKLP